MAALRSDGAAAATLSPNGMMSPPVPGTNVPPRQTALANRLNSALSASYADSEIRDALETLDSRGIQNTAETRRTLRLDVQKEVIDSNGKIIQDFGRVAEQLTRISDVIANLNTICQDMRSRLAIAHQETGPVLEEASTLRAQKEDAETKQALLNAFNTHFILPEEDVQALTSLAGPVDERFFHILSRVKQIHKDCEVLLGSENQKLGLDIMGQSSKNLNSAFLKLYNWIQKEFKSLNLEDPQVSGTIRKGIRVLAERPSLFHSCLDSFAEAREYILSDAFHHALTVALSSEGGDANTKPIEFSAHDPLRYVGDMLAWVHSATVSEREALEALFVSDADDLAKGMEAGIKSEPWTRVEEGEPVFDGQKALKELITRDLSGVARSLQQRVELVVQGHDDAVTIYKVINLLAFYETTFSKLVGAESMLVDTLSSLQRFTMEHFESLMQDRVKAASNDAAGLLPPDDLSPPEYLTECIENLELLMKAYDSSFGHEVINKAFQEDNKFTPILQATLDPMLELTEKSARSLNDPISRVIFRTNCVLAARAAVSSHEFASVTHSGSLSKTLANLRAELHKFQHEFLLEQSGLHTLLQALAPFTPGITSDNSNLATIASLPEFQPDALSTISQQLDDFLPAALVDATDNLKRVNSPSLVKSVTEEAVEAFSNDFEFIESMIIGADEANGKQEDRRESSVDSESGEEQEWSLRALFPRTTGEIRVLLS
ncbi:Golgi transport complex subunit 6 [Microsporum canis]|uniref:Conserved oligomeric Golgi complex subunit 6 n=1 Tax=Arthroderma otae (strain ATCC MYA-4605 / CBS 113480) TaxID=554155 RepID=C5FL60_ARTOC|nr:conserved oligomeric Golgi complex component 6 [Microsporum canis CBS 113480]EEQ30432.1 conserved oligomeric Golgi complex component 6 [Microsporum canis CBS 113480]